MFWHKHTWLTGIALPASILVLGLCAATTAQLWLKRNIDHQAEAEFGRYAERVGNEITRRFRQPIYGLNGARGVYATNPQVSRAQFQAYVESRDLPREFPGVRGFGFIQRVERQKLDDFVTATQADGVPSFALHQLADTHFDDLYVIKYIFPLAENFAASGLDIGSETRRRDAAQRAIDTGEPTLTAAVKLIQDTDMRPGMLLYVPVYRNGTDPATAAQRRDALIGLLYAPIVIAELLQGIPDVVAGRVDFQLYEEKDGETKDGAKNSTINSPIFDADDVDAAVVRPQAVEKKSQFSARRDLLLPGCRLALNVNSTTKFEAAYASPLPWLVFAGGVLASIILALLVRQLAVGQHRAEALAQHMTDDLDRLAAVARRTSNAVVILDAQRCITWVNEGFERMSGFSAAEAMGQSPAALLQIEGSDADTLKRMHQALEAGETFNGVMLNRNKQGIAYWTELEIQPRRNDRGIVTGYMAIESDITASKNAERDLARERKRLDNIIEGTDVGTWEWNVSTGEMQVNERCTQIIGYTRAELAPINSETMGSLAHPEDLAASLVTLKQHFDGELSNFACEIRLRHKKGHWVWILSRGKLFSRSDEGRPAWMAGTYMDISERKHAQEALRASQAFLDETGRIAGVGGWEVDLIANTMQWSDQTCRIHEVEPGHQPTLNEGLSYYAPEAQPLIKHAVEHSIATGEGFDLELPFITAKGRAIWVRAVGQVELVGNKPHRLAGAFQDITARRELETAIRRQNELMATVMENLPCGLTVFDADLKLVAANAEFRRLLDLPDALFDGPTPRYEDIIRFNAARGEYGVDIKSANAAENIEACVTATVERAKELVKPYRIERTRADGKSLEISGAPMPRGGFVTTYTDISSRRDAEAEVHRSSQLLRGAIETIDEAFVLFDPDDRLVFCNDKYREIFAATADLIVPGVSFEELVRKSAERGQRPAAIGHIDEWVAERMALHRSGNSTIVQQLADGRSLRTIERRMPDGHTVGFRIDITELVRATEAAQEAKAAAEAATSAKSQFLANTSHEIRTPMNAILGMLALLRKTELTPRQADYASKTEGAARSLLGLLNDILDFSKVDAGKMSLNPEPFRLDRLLRDLSVILSANIGAKPVEVLFDIDATLPRYLMGDALRLQQVLINLSSNAIKFTSEGEVVVSITVLAQDSVAVTLEIAVRDTGIGIAPENQARIFNAFTQAEASTTRRFGGTGLGVAISQRLVAMMGGQLKLESSLGEGSRFSFTVTLPVVTETAIDKPAVTNFHTLVVDDNPTAREVLERMCQSLGWTVDIADSGEQALALLNARNVAGKSYQAVFVDWQMPGLDGWETSRRIRDLNANTRANVHVNAHANVHANASAHDTATGTAPVIVMVTAYGREKMQEYSDLDQAMLDGFLVKPVTASMLFDAVVDARMGNGQGHPLLSKREPDVLPNRQRLEGLRLLIAEDNLNNQQIARELLQGEGAIVTIANHGQEAIDAIFNVSSDANLGERFDVVLMDLQMPIMDGFSATRKIRENHALQSLPIIAMTANAMASDREACLAVGMNDHVGKPFDLNHLVGVLRKHAGLDATPERIDRTMMAKVSANISDAASAANVEIVVALDRMGGSLSLYQRMLRTFIRDLEVMPSQLTHWVSIGDMESALRLLHTLKGVAATLGATALSTAGAQFEKQLALDAAPPPANSTTHATTSASATAQNACRAIREAIPGITTLLGIMEQEAPANAMPTSALDIDALVVALRAITGQLENADMAATDAMTNLQQQFGASQGAQLQPMDEAIHSLDFERALRLCDQLINNLLEGQPA